MDDGLLLVPKMKYAATDNAAMIAKVGSYLYNKGVFADLSLSANPAWKIEDYLEFGEKK